MFEKIANSKRKASDWNQTFGSLHLLDAFQRLNIINDNRHDTTVGKEIPPFAELIETEKRYNKKLIDIKFHYAKRLLAISQYFPEESIIHSDQIDLLFLNLDQLIELSNLILKELKSKFFLPPDK